MTYSGSGKVTNVSLITVEGMYIHTALTYFFIGSRCITIEHVISLALYSFLMIALHTPAIVKVLRMVCLSVFPFTC